MIESVDEILDDTKGGVGGGGERDLASRTFFPQNSSITYTLKQKTTHIHPLNLRMMLL